jgi:cyclic pyranopterin monophosphate synthase
MIVMIHRTLRPLLRSQRKCRFLSNGRDATAAAAAHEAFKQQMEDLAEERQELFGFTHEDRAAWSNPTTNPVMDRIQQAREQQHCQETSSPHTPAPHSSSSDNSRFTHVTADGASVSMVDVGDKVSTKRTATATAKVVFPPEVMAAFDTSSNELVGKKGPIFSTAKIAGIMAAKRCSDLIPLCHPLPLDKVHIDITLDGNVATISCECRLTHKTGVEMEALMGATVAALTIYDMCKAVSHRITIVETKLVAKHGGKRNVTNGDYV